MTLPEVDLETYIIFPFQIASTDKEKAINSEEFRAYLGDSEDWKKSDHIHEPDFIAKSDWKKTKSEPNKTNPETEIQEDYNPTESDLARIRYQAYNYFHPFVRSFWYNKKLIQRFRHQKLNKIKVTFKDAENIEFDAVADLYHIQPDIGIVTVHLKSKNKLAFSVAQNCLDRLRRVYPPYIDTIDNKVLGGHFPEQIELINKQNNSFANYNDKEISNLIQSALQYETNQSNNEVTDSHHHIFASHWSVLLEAIEKNKEYKIHQLGDDRASLVSKLSCHPTLNNEPIELKKEVHLTKAIDRGNMIRLCFADASGTDELPYAKNYLKNFESRFCYDRFWYENNESTDQPSRIMNCGYAFTWLGSKEDKIYFSNDFNGAPVAFRHIYVPMAIIAHFQKAALLVASRQLADLSPYEKDGKPKALEANKFKEIEANFIAFTQTFWFDEITPQEQGIELFEMWRRELKIKDAYQEFRQELQDIVAFINTEAALKLNRYAAKFAIAGLVLAYLSMLAGMLGINPIQTDILQEFSLEKATKDLHFTTFLILFISSLLIFIIFYFFPNTSKKALTKLADHIKRKINV